MSEHTAYLVLRVIPGAEFVCERYPVGVYSEESLKGLSREKGFPVILATARPNTFELAAQALDQAMEQYASAGFRVNGMRGSLVNVNGSIVLFEGAPK